MGITHSGHVEERVVPVDEDFASSRFGVLGGDWRRRLAAIVALAAVAALIAAWLTPRGPVTTIEALIAAGFVGWAVIAWTR